MKSTIDVGASTISIRNRIFLGFAAIAVILIIAIAIILVKVVYVKNFATQITSRDLPIFDSYIDLNGNLFYTQAMLYAWSATHNPIYKSEREKTWNLLNTSIDKIMSYAENSSIPKYMNNWNHLKSAFMKLKQTQDSIENKSVSKPSDALAIFNTELTPALNGVLDYMQGFYNASFGDRYGGIFDIHFNQIKSDSATITTDMETVEATLFSLLGLVIVASIFVAFYTARGINNYINVFRKHSSNIAAGDLTQRLVISSNDDMGKLGNDLNVMTESLAKVSAQINNACHDMISTLEEVKHASNVQSSGATEQASSINEITSSLEEIEKSSTQTIEKAKTLGEIAERTRSKSQLGLQAVEQSSTGMKTVREKVQTIAQTILELSNQTQQIGEITAVVNTLAQQSKMLALNASIEAAKAGDAGKGFAVVAAEVKNLAEQSEHSTSQVQKILEDIRHATEKAVMATEEGIKGVDQGTLLVEETGDTVRNLSDVIHEATIASQQIEAAIRQEGIGIEQITAGMNEINQVTHSYVESVKQTIEAISHLTANVKNLKEYIDIYKI
ncbi:MAG: methyl-accepting chemotaxis protein [Gammaproteobacteria bacterium]|nr:methyl-accepting chemotaxis protein [Gammaproteobacteria bacterium]